MRRLQRGDSPPWLARYVGGRDRWEDLDEPERRTELRRCLEQMQGSLCAYCEAALPEDWHVEHLWPRSLFPQRTFDWSNLFASCSRCATCGTYKDRGGRPYDPADLLDPVHDDPDCFLLFTRDGTVVPRDRLAAHDERRASETIRVFNLNHPGLVRTRKGVIDTVLLSEPDIVEVLTELPAADRECLLGDLLRDFAPDGFLTPLRHLLSA